jgi:uncharacterized protein (DUF2062 family)
MLFRRRHSSLYKAFIAAIWPHKGFLRGWIYLLTRTLRAHVSDYSLAAGFSAGVGMSFTPFIGFHVLLAILLATWIKGNVVVAFIGTIIGNPWTFPFIWALIYWVGTSILGIKAETDVLSLSYLLESPGSVLVAMTAGGVLTGLGFGLIAFALSYIFAARIKTRMGQFRQYWLAKRKIARQQHE